MRKMNGLLCVMLLSYCSVFSQTSTEHINIKGGTEAWDNFMKEVYLYPSFKEGILEYKNGKKYKSNFNYNKVIGTIQFISEKGDTLAFDDETAVKNVFIGDHVFFFGPACMQELVDAGKLKLVKNERLRIADKQKVGGYGIANSTGSIESVDRINSIDRKLLDVNENLLLNKTTNYYIETESYKLVPASKKNFLSLFPSRENEIKEYIKNKQINFSSEKDLIDLTGYISQL